jgi:hypothetical protein
MFEYVLRIIRRSHIYQFENITGNPDSVLETKVVQLWQKKY